MTGILSRRLDLPVYVANDANTAILAECIFGRTTAADLMLLRIGTDASAGLAVGGGLVQGHAWAAGEIGHVVTDPARGRCTCGRAGCLETVVAVPHLRHGDRPLACAGIVLGHVLAPVIAALNLHEVVLAGPPDLLDGEPRDVLGATIRERATAASAGDPSLVLSGELGVL